MNRLRTHRTALWTLVMAVAVVAVTQIPGASDVVRGVAAPISDAASLVFGSPTAPWGNGAGSAVGAPLPPHTTQRPGEDVVAGGQGAPLAPGSTEQAVVSPLNIPNFIGVGTGIPGDPEALAGLKTSQTDACLTANPGRVAECRQLTEEIFASIAFSSDAVPQGEDPNGCYYVTTAGAGGRPGVSVVGAGCLTSTAPGAFAENTLPKDRQTASDPADSPGEPQNASPSESDEKSEPPSSSDDTDVTSSSSAPSPTTDGSGDSQSSTDDDTSAPAK